MADDEQQAFLDEMADVAPIKPSGRVRLRGGAAASDEAMSHRRQAAEHQAEPDRNLLSEDGVEPLDPWYVLEFKRPGVQNGVYRKLRQGRYDSEARLDMHRMTVLRARAELFDFIEQAQQLGLRSVLVIHGKGESVAQRERSSILKGCCNHWLRQLDAVQAFHSAQPRHGGTGAVYILLKKSEQSKRENRERFMKGRVPYEK